jgi:GT2 family glycosyltransferase
MAAAPGRARVRVDGKFFRLGEAKFFVKGVAYGPFAQNSAGQPFASAEQTAEDFTRIVELGANVIRIYAVPPRWFLEMALERGLRVLVDIPWSQHVCFLDRREGREQAKEAIRKAVSACGGHPGVFAFSIGNEIPADIVRWSGAKRTARFLDELVFEAKRIDPECLCTYANFPTTEYLRPAAIDFVCFNLYLHQETATRAYLARLQMLADGKPLLLGEFGFDSLREGEARKSEMLRWQIETAFRSGLAGCVVFSFTDDWHRNGAPVTGWALGLTTVNREPKPSFAAVRDAFERVPRLPLPRTPRVSVVVANFNGERTLNACLESLKKIAYPDYEIILVDDGSTDRSTTIARAHPQVRLIQHERNLGLSAARNTGVAAASGEVIAFTDSDCRVDEDWLYYLVGDLLNSDFAAIGGPNLLPPEDSALAAAVMASPGGPAHVMLTDRQAEHIPGCNMAFYRQALLDIGGFDPIFKQAGDDVDVCWRLDQAGCKIGFSPSALVWHYRRSTVRDYLKQQRGYGEAEALLVRKHPEYFNALGGSIWRGRIYGTGNLGPVLEPDVIYRGLFSSAGFQALYASRPSMSLMLATSFEYYLAIVLPLTVLSVIFPALAPVAIASLALPLIISAAAAKQAILPSNRTRWWSRPLVATLSLLQPITRGWARHQGRLSSGFRLSSKQPNLDSIALRDSGQSLDRLDYWSERRVDRLKWVQNILHRLEEQDWPHRPDAGWSDYDVEIYGTLWCKLQLISVAEDHSSGGQMIRMRLRPRWSLRAATVFWMVTAATLLVIGVVSRFSPWIWLLLLALPAAGWLLSRDKRNLQSMMAVFLDDLSKEWGFVKVPAKPEKIPVSHPVEQAPTHSPFAKSEVTRAPVSRQDDPRA